MFVCRHRRSPHLVRVKYEMFLRHTRAECFSLLLLCLVLWPRVNAPAAVFIGVMSNVESSHLEMRLSNTPNPRFTSSPIINVRKYRSDTDKLRFMNILIDSNVDKALRWLNCTMCELWTIARYLSTNTTYSTNAPNSARTKTSSLISMPFRMFAYCVCCVCRVCCVCLLHQVASTSTIC